MLFLRKRLYVGNLSPSHKIVIERPDAPQIVVHAHVYANMYFAVHLLKR